MKTLIAVCVLTLTGCATSPDYRPAPTMTIARPPSVSLEQLTAISQKLSNRDCANLDRNIAFIEEQLRNRGLANRSPEELDDPDRVYNATAKMMIWALRIGCNNPERYVAQ
jgi:hypothetical protein